MGPNQMDEAGSEWTIDTVVKGKECEGMKHSMRR